MIVFVGHYSACSQKSKLKRSRQMTLESAVSGESTRIIKRKRKAKHAKTDKPVDSDIERISSDEKDSDIE